MVPAQRTAEQLNILGRATSRCDNYANQVLRATLDYEDVYGPDFRATIMTGSGNGRILLSYWPVVAITSVQVAASNPAGRQWVTIPSGDYVPEVPAQSAYGATAPSSAVNGGQAILIPPGYLNWANGRNGWVVRVQYVNGWPHTSLTAAVDAGATTLPVDDCTGWAVTNAWGQTGNPGLFYDSGYQETVQVTAASATSGPGNLTVKAGTGYAHAAGTILTTLPQSVIDAMILFSAAQALQRGATSTTVHAIPGGAGGGGSLGTISEYIAAGEMLLHPFRRTI